ncbi:MAG TPA: transglutaminase domain-containing protein [Bryobacteraceae bacterium]
MKQKRIVGIALLLLFEVATIAAQPHSRQFHLDYKVTVNNLPSSHHRFELWIPVPHDGPYQRIRGLRVNSPYPYEITEAANGNTMVHLSAGQNMERTFALTISLDAARVEHIEPLHFRTVRMAQDDRVEQFGPYLKSDRLVPLDDQIRAWARDVALNANARTDIEKANAIYRHVISTVKYDKSGKGWGRGDIYYACQERRGNCTDFHAIFIGYARALGIPARFAIGLSLPADRGEGKLAGYHCWAEFYAKGIGWVPVDAAEAAKNPAKRDYFFGAIDENRIQLSEGRDVILAPKQSSDPLNYFVYPYAELDGKPFTGTTYDFEYRDTMNQAEAALH